jgi:hypothetical protein
MSPAGCLSFIVRQAFEMIHATLYGSLEGSPSMVFFGVGLTADARRLFGAVAPAHLASVDARCGKWPSRGSNLWASSARGKAVLDHARNVRRVRLCCGTARLQIMAVNRQRQRAGAALRLSNQTLQTTPMTRSIYEKTIEFERLQRGV